MALDIPDIPKDIMDQLRAGQTSATIPNNTPFSSSSILVPTTSSPGPFRSSASHSSSWSPGEIAGLVVGLVVFLALITLVIYLRYRRTAVKQSKLSPGSTYGGSIGKNHQ